MEHPIAKYRREKNLTQDAFGELVGATKGMVSKWEAGRILPRPHSIVRIEDVTGMSVSASDIVRMFYHFSQGNEVAQ
ncbi:helix-turn-helix domain-containing protein [Agrobacterium vitis]|uniref:helix-turn-helix domain-containing protein n=1 Tax=Agrobacterium vitis TaxID=373 RepID=UPI0015725F59|nr:helix-turn-helix transcriptional regulator [Agrobacterium vitis]QZO05099.1 helix-turn-helix transcriptional regulator [Agrobacterium vitis]UJL87247.1 helix-turn-helix transcriptional regulator [Agrobacterium vitis]